MSTNYVDNGPMLNAYPDSMGGKMSDIVAVLGKSEFKDVFQSFYILPSIFNTDLDRGFSVIDYSINEEMADKKDILTELKYMDPEQLNQLADEIRSDMIRTVSKTGGHLASSLGVVELTIALHFVFSMERSSRKKSLATSR